MPISLVEKRIPLKMHVQGVSTDGKTTSPIDLTYTFVDFIPYGPGVMEDDTDLFESPAGVYCGNKKSPANLTPPKTPEAGFSYKAQVTQPAIMKNKRNMIKNIEAFYDVEARLTRLDHKSVAGEFDVEIESG